MIVAAADSHDAFGARRSVQGAVPTVRDAEHDHSGDHRAPVSLAVAGPDAGESWC